MPALQPYTSESGEFSSLLNQGSKWTRPLVLSIFTSIFGGTFTFGYIEACLNLPHTVIANSFCGDDECIDNVLWRAIVSVFCLGGILGAIVAGKLITCHGYRRIVLLSAAILGGGCLIMAFSVSPYMLLVGRLIAGIASGISTVSVPMYLTDIAPTSVRGFVGSLSQLGITIGILLGQVLGLDMFFGNEHRWRWLVGAPMAVVFLQLVAFSWILESPKWLIIHKREENEALEVLRHLRNKYDVNTEMTQIRDTEVPRVLAVKDTPYLKTIFLDADRSKLKAGVALQMAQQFSGINAIFYYSVIIFKELNILDGNIITVVVGAVNVLATVGACFLQDHLGRRVLLMTSTLGMALSYCLFTPALVEGITVLAAVSVLMGIISFAIGLGPVAWFMLTELFPTSSAPGAISFCVCFNWLGNFLVASIFSDFYLWLGAYAFLPFLFIVLVSTALFGRYLPETKNLTLCQIEDAFSNKRSGSVNVIHIASPGASRNQSFRKGLSLGRDSGMLSPGGEYGQATSLLNDFH